MAVALGFYVRKAGVTAEKIEREISRKASLMAQTTTIIYADEKLARVLPIVAPFTPVKTWDNETRTMTDKQQTDDQTGFPLWETEAMMRQGFGGRIGPIRVRIASATAPTVQPDPAVVMAAMGISIPKTAPSTPRTSAPRA